MEKDKTGKPKLSGISLKNKLIGGFAILIALLLVVAADGYNALISSSEGFSQYREMARDSNLMGQLETNMLHVRMNVKDFIITGNEKDVEEYDEYIGKMELFLKSAKNDINHPKRAEKIAVIDSDMKTYREAFKRIISFKHQRNDIVNNNLNVNGPMMEKKLTRIMETADRDGDMTAAFNSGIAMKHLLLGRLYVVKFLDSNGGKDIERVISEFREVADKLKILDSELENPERKKLLETVKDLKGTYLAGFEQLRKIISERNKVISGSLDRIGPTIAEEVNEVKHSIMDVQELKSSPPPPKRSQII